MSIQPPVLPFSPHEGMADITQQHIEDARDHNAVAQARAAMPKMEENDDSVFEATTGVKNTALGKAYSAASDWLGEHEKNLSEKYLAPFRAGLDNMAMDLQQAGATGHTASGGELSPLSRALVSGAGTMLRSVPVGKDVKDTVARNAFIPGKVSRIDFSGIPGHIEQGIEGQAEKEAIDVTPQTVKKAEVVAPQEPHEMSPKDLDAEITRKSTKDQQTDESILGGPEAAKQYNRLHRALSSHDDGVVDRAQKQIDEIESKLSPEQVDKLYGVKEKGPSLDELKEYRSAVGSIGGKSPEELGQSMKYAISDLGTANLENIKNLGSKQKVAYATVKEGFRQAAELGFDPNEVLQSALAAASKRFGGDAEEMLRTFMKPKQ